MLYLLAESHNSIIWFDNVTSNHFYMLKRDDAFNFFLGSFLYIFNDLFHFSDLVLFPRETVMGVRGETTNTSGKK